MSPRSGLGRYAPCPRPHGETVPDTVARTDPVREIACRFIPPTPMMLLRAVLASGDQHGQATDDTPACRPGPIALIDRSPAFKEAKTRWCATRA